MNLHLAPSRHQREKWVSNLCRLHPRSILLSVCRARMPVVQKMVKDESYSIICLLFICHTGGVIQLDEDIPTEPPAILTPVSPSPSSSALDQRVFSQGNKFTRLNHSQSRSASEIIDLTSGHSSVVASLSSRRSSASHASYSTRGRSFVSPTDSNELSAEDDNVIEFERNNHSSPNHGSRISSTSVSRRNSSPSSRRTSSFRASSIASIDKHAPHAFVCASSEPSQLRKSSRLAIRPTRERACSPLSGSLNELHSTNSGIDIRIKSEDGNDQLLASRATRSTRRVINAGLSADSSKG